MVLLNFNYILIKCYVGGASEVHKLCDTCDACGTKFLFFFNKKICVESEAI